MSKSSDIFETVKLMMDPDGLNPALVHLHNWRRERGAVLLIADLHPTEKKWGAGRLKDFNPDVADHQVTVGDIRGGIRMRGRVGEILDWIAAEIAAPWCLRAAAYHVSHVRLAFCFARLPDAVKFSLIWKGVEF